MTADDRQLPAPKAVIFDLDGTLVDTVQTRIDAWLATFEEAGIPSSKEELGPLIGVDGKRLAREVAALAGQPIDDARAEDIDVGGGAGPRQRTDHRRCQPRRAH
jgi:beta-phosphoglucomutase-like phosphatase (HAD superfamily)